MRIVPCASSCASLNPCLGHCVAWFPWWECSTSRPWWHFLSFGGVNQQSLRRCCAPGRSSFSQAGRGAAVPSQYDLEHAWPTYSYIVIVVEKGHAADLRSWELESDRSRFNEEEITGPWSDK